MKKVFAIVSAIIIFLAVIAGVFLFNFVNSPQYALKKTISDIKSDGYAGLRTHLSDDVAEKLDKIVSLGDNEIVKGILSAVSESKYISKLLNEAGNIKWELGDVLSNRRKASVTIYFSYGGQFSGSIDVNMAKDDGMWKICGMDIPKFD